MKLLYILSEYLPDSGGGIITHYGRILPRLVERGHDVSVLLSSRDKLDCADYEIDGVKVQSLKSRYLHSYDNRFRRWEGLNVLYYLLPVAWAARQQAQECFDVDLVEVVDWALLFMPWMVTENPVRVVVSLHGSCGQVDWFWRPSSGQLDSDLTRMIEQIAMKQADGIHANSNSNATFWRERIGQQIRVIPPAYSTSSGSTFPLFRNQRETRGLVVGRLQNWKGPEVLCQALRSSPEITVEWIGADTEWDTFGLMTSKYLAQNYPSVFGNNLLYLGPLGVSDVIAKMETSSFLIAPSLWDVFNLTVAEGMEAGLPVVCSKAAGAEMLIDHGVNGFLFDPDDPSDLLSCLRTVNKMNNDERLEMGHRARLAIKTLMNECLVLQALEEAYASVLAKTSSPLRDPWLESLLKPSSQLKISDNPGLARRVARKLASVLKKLS